ncbi:MAG: hypothetical protein JO166_01900 [Deltaproteobacteria bacterium]|nr:hypothetical protein [Deltaproteobacteria bacterium]
MCDSQSAPEFSHTCIPDTDSNVFDSADPHAANYVGKHPGTAFTEMQFYPPGWVAWPQGTSCDGHHWCAALTIDSLNEDLNHNINNNVSCQNRVGLEPVNFALITIYGGADSPADPLNPSHFTPKLNHDLMMNPGDSLAIDMHDTAAGFQVVIYDLTTHRSGSMTASVQNGFAQVDFAPNAGSSSARRTHSTRCTQPLGPIRVFHGQCTHPMFLFQTRLDISNIAIP